MNGATGVPLKATRRLLLLLLCLAQAACYAEPPSGVQRLPHPVYNVTYDTARGPARNELPAARSVKATFWLGAPGESAPLTNKQVSPALLDLVKSNGGAVFDVTAICHVCRDMTPRTRTIAVDRFGYAPAPVQFEFLPDTGNRPQRRGSITFSLAKDGIEYDFVNAPVIVFAEGAQVTEHAGAETCSMSEVAAGTEPFDLVIYVSYDENDRIRAQFVPTSPALKQAIGPLVRDAQGDPRSFTLGASATGLAQQLATGFVIVKSIVDQTPDRNGVIDVPALTNDAKFGFTDAQEKAVAKQLYKIGVNLYDELFYNRGRSGGSGREVTKIVQQIEAAGASSAVPLRIGFFSNQIYIPWQLLHPADRNPAAPRVDGFWGFKYIISSIPQTDGRACGPLPATIAWPDKVNLVYGAFRSTVPKAPGEDPDFVTGFAQVFGDALQKDFGFSPLASAVTSDAFLGALTNDRSTVSSIVVFSHGHSGSTIVPMPGAPGQYGVIADVNGPRIDFSERDSLNYLDLSAATVTDDRTVPFFKSRPFVLLNGCETGTAGIARTSENSFPGIFLDRGAAVVLATEAPVWDQFGLGFASHLMGLLAQGHAIGDALLLSRKYYLEKARNPLGLIYSLYGNPSASFQRLGNIASRPLVPPG